jgi:hypothetical protein
MKIRELLCEAEYPASAATAYIVELVKRIHSNTPDFEQGNLVNRIWRFRQYILQPFPVNQLNPHEWDVGEDIVSQYARMSPDTSPPIVYDPIARSIIDGVHRVAAAAQRGDQSVLAYVGADPDPNWSDEDGEE